MTVQALIHTHCCFVKRCTEMLNNSKITDSFAINTQPQEQLP